MKNIPPIIHYCWFGGKPLPMQYKRYLETWKQAFPHHKIIKWDEHNFPIDEFGYAREAKKAGKMAFVSDVARIYALYEYGGIYFDTDVEVIKNFAWLLEGKEAVLGTEDEGKTIGTGFMAFIPHHDICTKMLDYYRNNSFIEQNSTMSNTQILAALVKKEYGIVPLENTQEFNNIILYPSEYFTAYNGLTGEDKITDKTCCIHHFAASWHSPNRKLKDAIKKRLNKLMRQF